jgi:hypothetical protein
MSVPGQPDWWFCRERDCDSSNRVYGLEAQFCLQLWLERLRGDIRGMCIIWDQLQKQAMIPPARVADGAFVKLVENLLMSGRLHIHRKQGEVSAGSGQQEQSVPFPLADRQPRGSSSPPPIIDPPSFSPNADLSAQAAILAAAAASGTPFCQL